MIRVVAVVVLATFAVPGRAGQVKDNPEFNGKKTANGEHFNCESLTAAHPNLPFGSWVRVVNARNGKFEVVRINDRGPYQEGREIDVSYRVARKIGLIHSGVSQVRLELMQLPEKPAKP